MYYFIIKASNLNNSYVNLLKSRYHKSVKIIEITNNKDKETVKHS